MSLSLHVEIAFSCIALILLDSLLSEAILAKEMLGEIIAIVPAI